MNLPSYEFLAAPLWLVNALHIITLSLHLMAMNVVVGSLAVVLWGRWTDRRQHPVVVQVVRILPSAMAATVTLGVAPLLFVQMVYPRQMFSSAIVGGWYWLSVFVLVMIAYYALYGAAGANVTRRRPLLSLALLALALVSVVYSGVFSMAEQPNRIAEAYSHVQSGWYLPSWDLNHTLRWLHMILGAVMVGSYFVAVIGRHHEEAVSIAKKFFLISFIVNLVVGIGYVGTLGPDLRPFMRSTGIWVLLVAVILSLRAAHLFAKRRWLGSGIMICISVIGMVTARHQLRLIRLEGHYDPSTLPVQTGWGVIAVFLLCFVVALGLLGYMLKIFMASAEPEANVAKTE